MANFSNSQCEQSGGSADEDEQIFEETSQDRDFIDDSEQLNEIRPADHFLDAKKHELEMSRLRNYMHQNPNLQEALQQSMDGDTASQHSAHSNAAHLRGEAESIPFVEDLAICHEILDVEDNDHQTPPPSPMAEAPPQAVSKGFRCNSAQFFLTYAQCDIPKEHMLHHIQSILEKNYPEWHLLEYLIAEEIPCGPWQAFALLS